MCSLCTKPKQQKIFYQNILIQFFKGKGKMGYWSSSDSDFYNYSDDESGEYNDDYDYDNEMVWCQHCPNKMPRFALKEHIKRKHIVQCQFCNNQMPESSLQGHIERKHVECIHCGERVAESDMEEHIVQEHHVWCHICNNRMPPESLSAHIMRKHSRNRNTSRHYMKVRMTPELFREFGQQQRIFEKNGEYFMD